MKQSLQLRTSQHLALTPQLQQSIRLLQLSTLELHQELSTLLIENPMLEREDDPLDKASRLQNDGSLSDASSLSGSEFSQSEPLKTEVSSSSTTDQEEFKSEGDIENTNKTEEEWSYDSETPSIQKSNDNDESPFQLESSPISLKDHLLEQMRVNTRSLRDRALVEIIIDALDENGYLTETLDEINDSLPIDLCVDIDELSFALKMLQSFDPNGVGARNIMECLSIQIKRFPDIAFVTRRMALQIVESHLTLLAQKDYAKLRKILNCDDEDLKEAQTVIQMCNPKPGLIYSHEKADYVAPDVVIKKIGDQWHALLNQDVIPRLRVNNLYANLLKQNRGETNLTGQLQEARWLIKNMRQRFDTILRVSQAIVERQYHFFTHGAIAMKPLVLREIADTLGLHESTISRVTTQKYMLTPHGMFELKYFFGSHVATEAGGEASSTAIRALIKQLIGDENTSQPLSDSKLAEMLGEQGMVVARRTVAKYRDGLKIPPVNMRKSL